MGHLLIVHSGARPTTVTIALDLTVSQLACILEYIYIIMYKYASIVDNLFIHYVNYSDTCFR